VFRFPAGERDFSLLPGVETGSVATHSPIQWDKRTPSQELKRPLCEVDHSCPYTTGLKSA
jgi:hypothetical protein